MKALLLLPLLALTGCVSLDPADPQRICIDATRGARAPDLQDMVNQCQAEVYTAEYRAGYDRARFYRDLPR
jgi:hypothetical protein